MSERFYLNSALTPGPITVTGPEAHHLATVCRLRPGAQVCFFNGDGLDYRARILAVDRKTIVADVLEALPTQRELAFSLEIAAPLPKGDRAQLLIEKLTELGVTTFVPLDCARASVRPGEGKLDKLQRYVIEASKQCGRNVLMQIEELTSWAVYCRRGEDGELRYVAHPGTGVRSQESGVRGQESAQRIRCAVGPEGGFTDEEYQLAVDAGWQQLDLGPRILRIETAAILCACLAMVRP